MVSHLKKNSISEARSSSSGERVRIRQKEPFLIAEQANDLYGYTRTWTYSSD